MLTFKKIAVTHLKYQMGGIRYTFIMANTGTPQKKCSQMNVAPYMEVL